jgi:predicted permease
MWSFYGIINKNVRSKEMNSFWREWIKLVAMLLIILVLWVGFIFVCDKYFGKSFEEMRYIHYLIFMMLIIKAKNIFLKNVNKDKKDIEKR